MKDLSKKPSKHILIAIAFLLVLALPACRGIAFSPEQAAINAIRGNIEQNVNIVDNSVEVRQSVEAREDLYVVVMTYTQLRASSGEETCLYTYEVEKRMYGWSPKSGGGGCWSAGQVEGLTEDIQIGAGQSFSDAPGDPGFSQAYGLVRNPEIVKVKIQWTDGLEEELPVDGSTFVAFRFGLFDMTKLEGLNENGDVLYTFGAAQIAPGKTP